MAMPTTEQLEQLDRNQNHIVELIGIIANAMEHVTDSPFIYEFDIMSHLDDAMLQTHKELKLLVGEIEHVLKSGNLLKLREAEIMRVTHNDAVDINFYNNDIAVFHFDGLPHKIVFYKLSDKIDTFGELK